MQEQSLPFFFSPNPAPIHQEHPWEILVLGTLSLGARGGWRGAGGGAGGGDELGKWDADRAVVCPGELCTVAQPSLERCYWRSD